MLKQYNNLWVFGDSYTTPDCCVDKKESFWGIVGDIYSASIINCSWPGNSFTSVWHMLIGMQNQFDWKNDLFLIGIPPLERLTIFDNFKDTEYNSTVINTQTWLSEKKKIQCHTGLEQIKGHEAQSMVVYEDRAWTETQALDIIFLLTSWLDSLQANYIIINLSKPFDNCNKWGPSEFILPYAIHHPRCILYNDTYYSINLNINKPADFNKYGWDGHHGPEGNKYFYEKSLLPIMKKCNLV